MISGYNFVAQFTKFITYFINDIEIKKENHALKLVDNIEYIYNDRIKIWSLSNSWREKHSLTKQSDNETQDLIESEENIKKENYETSDSSDKLQNVFASLGES